MGLGNGALSCAALSKPLIFSPLLKPELAMWVGRLGKAPGGQQPLALSLWSLRCTAPSLCYLQPLHNVSKNKIILILLHRPELVLGSQAPLLAFVCEVLSCSGFPPHFKDAGGSALACLTLSLPCQPLEAVLHRGTEGFVQFLRVLGHEPASTDLRAETLRGAGNEGAVGLSGCVRSL